MTAIMKSFFLDRIPTKSEGLALTFLSASGAGEPNW
jgi:hypothetical protein